MNEILRQVKEFMKDDPESWKHCACAVQNVDDQKGLKEAHAILVTRGQSETKSDTLRILLKKGVKSTIEEPIIAYKDL